MGAVDLVIQVESPKSVARRPPARRPRRAPARRRRRRAASSPSTAPTCSSARSSRAACATARSRRRASRATRSTSSRSRSSRSPRRRRSPSTTCTTSSAARTRSATSRGRSSRTCSTCSPAATRRRSSPSCGPRIVWDRTGGVVRGREGARRLAVTNAGTIPDRGLFGVYLVDGGGRVGELDEEMVYEARAGQTFLLGASTWRIEEITRDRVLVSPAPGIPGRGSVLEGRGRRPPVRARRRDRAHRARARRRSTTTSAAERLRDEHSLDERAARNLVTFLREQEAATGVVPSDRTIVVERFRDEIGDWRVCVLTPFGGRVHAPWSLALAARLRDSLGLEVNAIWSDDGIALHLPDADAPPPLEDLLVDPGELEDLVVAELGGSALFGARFRENAGPRAPHPAPPPRRADAALAAAAQGAGAPAGRAPLPRLPGRARDRARVPPGRVRPARAALAARRPAGRAASTSSRSRRRPRRRSPPRSLFDYVATYMYEDDTPLAERRAQALALDRDLLRELLGQEELRDLLDADALEQVEEELRGDARTPDELHDLLLRRGDLAPGEYDEALAEPLAGRAARGASSASAGGDAADRRRGRRPLPRRARRDAARRTPGRVPRRRRGAASVPARPLRARPRAVHDRRGGRALRARSRSHGAGARGARGATTGSSAASSAPAEPSASGAIPMSSGGCAARASRACAARSSPPHRPRSPASCPPGRGRPPRDAPRGARPAPGPVAAGRALGVRCPPAARARVPAGGARPALRLRRGRLGRRRARAGGALLPRGRARARTAGRAAAARGRGARRDPRRPRARARSSGTTCSATTGLEARDRPAGALGSRLGGRGDERRVAAASRQRAGSRRRGPSAAPRRFSRQRANAITATQGRWSTTAGLFAGEPDQRALAELLLERQGIVTRDGVRGRGRAGRLRPRLRGAAQARDARRLPARLLRREPRRRPVRAAGRGRAPARGARGGRAARPRRGRPRAAVRRGDPVAEARRRPRGPRRRCVRRDCSAASRRSSSSAAAARSSRSATRTRPGSARRSRRSSSTPAAPA